MWLGVLVALSVASSSWSQHEHAGQQVEQSDANFGWGWQLTPVEQYYIEPVHQFAGGEDVFQHAAPLAPTDVALQPAQAQVYQNTVNQTQAATIRAFSEHTPLDIILLNQQFPFQFLRTLNNDFPADLLQYTNIPHNLNGPNTFTQTGYNIQTEHPTTNKNIEDVKRIDKADSISNTQRSQSEFNIKENNLPIDPIVQVFKDHNCTEDEVRTTKDYNSNVQKTSDIVPSVSSYNEDNVNDNFGARKPKESSLYKGAAKFNIETRANTNNEGYYYYSTEITPTVRSYRYDDLDGISRLVASTQDLISNDDLIRINHSVEEHIPDISDDYIKPRPRYNSEVATSHYYDNPRNTLTVKAKIHNIGNGAVEYSGKPNEAVYHNDKFMSPIVVQDSNEDDYKEQILNTLVSTMAPYIENGYEIAKITKNTEQNANIYVPQHYNKDTVHVTPRPVGQKYLAPLTVALRLLNSNHTEIFNSVDDHDVSDSEVIEERVKSPVKEETVVEIQESIPVDITHINDVEVHQYLDISPSNLNQFDVQRNLYNTYMKALQVKKNDEETMNKILNGINNRVKDDSNEHEVNSNNEQSNNETDETDKIESSENMQDPVSVTLNNFNSNGNKNDNYYDRRYVNNGKVIQPIVIEKEVPVPQYIDRYDEKQVPYPQPVVKRVPVDRPVPVPVPYEKIVEKPVEITKYINKPYPIEIPQPYPVPVKVPYPVEQKVYVDRPVHVPYQVQKQIVHTVPVPTPVAVPIKVQVPVEKPVIFPVPVVKPYPVPYEKTVRVPYPVEKRIPVPVEKVVEKPVHVPVPVPVHIVKHYPVDRIVEKKVPVIFPVDRIVEKKVSVRVPYPVEKVVEKIVEKPVVVTKYIDKPYPVETRVPYVVEKNPYTVQVPYVAENTQNLPQYQQYEAKRDPSPNSVRSEQDAKLLKDEIDQYYRYVNERQHTLMLPVQTTKWGNLYASTYKYLNVTPDKLPEASHTNSNYYGPPPMLNSPNVWRNGDTNVDKNAGRPERTPKVTNLRIEYGFKPPLIPSTEVDLDGRPINKASET